MGAPREDICNFTMNDYKLVLVIGNGFDLDLGLPTSYHDFLQSDDFTTCLNPIKKNHNCIFQDSDNLFQYLQKKYQCQNWIDIEMELRNMATQIYRGVDNRGQVIQTLPTASEGKTKSFELLCKQLCLYLKKLDYKFIKTRSTALKLFSIINDYHYISEIITFNYTDLHQLENELDTKIEVKIDHVHGSIENNDIIIGFEDEVDIDKSYSFMIKSFNPAFKSHNVRQKLLEANEIIFFGHSLGETDYHYFEDLFKYQSQPEYCKESKTIRIFTYDEKSRIDILFQLRAMNNKRTDMLFDLNDFEIYRTKNDSLKINEYLKKLPERLRSKWLENVL